MKTLFILLISCFSLIVTAQKPSVLWLQGIGGGLDDYCGG